MRPGRRSGARTLSGPWLAAFLLLIAALWTSASGLGGEGRTWEIEAVMPEHPAEAESYLCMRVDLPSEGSVKLVGVEPLSSQELVHHMLLFGCEQRTEQQGVWPCQGHGVCPGGGNQQILYGWAKGAPPMHLPDGVGYKVGSGTKIENLVLQIHFAVERPAKDLSGVKLHLSERHLPFYAGMIMYASYFEIPPKQEEHLISAACCYSGFEPSHAVAYRVHTHSLGRSVFMDEVLKDGSKRRMVEHSPQLPQGFTPVGNVTFWPGQKLEATCAFNSMERSEKTYAGATHHDEMCNLYMIHWSELPVFINCYGGHLDTDRHGAGGVAHPAALLKEDSKHWQPPAMGQISGVGKGQHGTVWVFHRGDRVWDSNSFSGNRSQHTTYKEPIAAKTVVQLDQDSGEVLASWGADAFLMPHMVTVDRWGFVWVTDVGLHQVFKFDAAGNLNMTLGTRLVPGRGSSFCKPTQVAVANDGRIFVSDGYCNSRVAEFAPNGTHLGDFELEEGAMNVPHSLLLDECSDALLVADRESARVHRFDMWSRKLTGTWDLSQHGNVYALAAGPYGTHFALCWDLPHRVDGLSRLVLLHSDPGQGVEEAWTLEGVQAPHDLTLVAAPVRLAIAERPLAALVGETRASGSKLHKFIIMPAGTAELPHDNGAHLLGSASHHWRAVLAASDAAAEALAKQQPSEASDEAHNHGSHGPRHASHGAKSEEKVVGALSGADAGMSNPQLLAAHAAGSRLAAALAVLAALAGCLLAYRRYRGADLPKP